MRTYLKFVVIKYNKNKAKKFGLKWDNLKKSWYTENIENYLELKARDNQRIMKNTQNILKKYENNV